MEKESLIMTKNAVSAKAVSSKAMEMNREFALIDSRDGSTAATFSTADDKDKEQHEEDMKALVRQMADKFDQPMTPSKVKDGNLLPGQSRVVLDEEALFNQLLNLSAFNHEIPLPITETAPNITQEALNGAAQTVIGSYKTTFNPSVAGRSTNIALSSNAIDDIVLGPGDRFYFNLTVGERTTARGYQKALEIVNKEFVEGIGGGICQTSSTLYNAVAKAGLEIIELHHHSKEVGYVPINQDATVSWGGYDFKFMNNKDFPVIIKTIINQKSGSLEVQILAASKTK
ncbi:VanW family protein [Peribacillus frigoritolerans]|uniref:VanW family protein n=1 Tax=Peribacillus frigoritolerans TaxID=450367 RepID=UPI00105A7E72|nr:VanW family protein [Peribacillus frigoritolerans]TDL80069.1 vancomycin resistance protein [Peribacillus frigoritolerans]